jgi:serine/threonine protein kinase
MIRDERGATALGVGARPASWDTAAARARRGPGSSVSEGRRYKIEGVLGKGGFGTVYKAQLLGEGGFTRSVALKVLNADMEGIEDVARRLRDEARLLGLLRHRAILHVDGLVRIDGRWTVIMEYIDGVDLQVVARGGACPLGPALEIVGEVASALHVAYTTTSPEGAQLKLLHRDIKPPNILLTSAGEVKVLDFGIARAEFDNREAQTRSVLYGSVGYMAPERLDFQELHEGDVYALGTVLFEILTGSPFGKASIRVERHQKAVDDAVDLLRRKIVGLPEAFCEMLSSMLAYDPEDRPTAREVERRCRAIRQQIDGPWLRDWAEKAVPPLVQSRRLGADDAFSGSVVSESGGVSLLVDDPVRVGAPSSTMPLDAGADAGPRERQPAPPQPARAARPAPGPRQRSLLGTVATTLGVFGCIGGLAAFSLAILLVAAVFAALAPDPYEPPPLVVGSFDEPFLAPPPAPDLRPPASAPAPKPVARSGATLRPPGQTLPKSRVVAPWSELSLPIAPGVPVHSDDTSLVVFYGGAPVADVAHLWRGALGAQGWEIEYEIDQAEMSTTTMLRGGRRLALTVTMNMGDIIVTTGLVN